MPFKNIVTGGGNKVLLLCVVPSCFMERTTWWKEYGEEGRRLLNGYAFIQHPGEVSSSKLGGVKQGTQLGWVYLTFSHFYTEWLCISKHPFFICLCFGFFALQNVRRCECKVGYVGNGLQCLEEAVPPTDRCLEENGQCHPDALCTDLHFHGMCLFPLLFHGTVLNSSCCCSLIFALEGHQTSRMEWNFQGQKLPPLAEVVLLLWMDVLW